jgi:hypothetical protein
MHRFEDGTLKEFGQIEGSKSSVMPLRNDPFYSATSLKTNDIMGCQTGTKGLGNFHTRIRE